MPPWQGVCVFENQFTLRLAHRIHLDFQNLINMPNLRQYGSAHAGFLSHWGAEEEV